MPLIGGARVVATGDSISVPDGLGNAWYTAAVATIDAYYVAHPHLAPGVPGNVSGVQAHNSGVPSNTPLTSDLRMEVFNSAVAGTGIQHLYDNRATRLFAFGPLDAVIIRVGVNDVPIGGSFSTVYGQVIDAIRAAYPACYIVCHAILCRGELWNAGPAWGPNADDASILTGNTAIASLCASKGCVYVDDRASLLTWESVNNTPAPGAANGKFTGAGDGIHPIPAVGWSLMSSWFVSAITLEP